MIYLCCLRFLRDLKNWEKWAKMAAPESANVYYYGLYLKQGGKLYDGKGLLLGPNSPFANIPILGAIL